MPKRIVAILNDLLFTVKISDAAKRAGASVEFVKTAEDCARKAEGADAVILDLNFAPAELILRIKSCESTKSIPLIGFVSHVQTELIRHARECGCDTVMARSAFVHRLPELLSTDSSEAAG